MQNHLSLYLNGRPLRVAGDDAWLMLSSFLRKRQALPGTKVVCAEGDCGSCSVLVGRPVAGRMVYRSVASCIVQVLQLDACHVVTVEGLTPRGGLNPFQKAMVSCQGAQCGFCTPGFVVAMQEVYQGDGEVDAHAVRRGLTGNLCRCTGYDSIVRAALETDLAAMPHVDDLYPPGPMVKALGEAAGEAVLLESEERRFYKPVTVEQATRFLADEAGDDADVEGSSGGVASAGATGGGGAVILGGGTDLGVLQNKGRLAVNVAMHTGGLAELHDVRVEGDTLVVGGAATLRQFERAAEAHLPDLAEFLGWFGSPPIRNAGTLAGNLCTASPIGDTPPALYVLGAEVELASTRGRCTVSVEEFHTGYRTTQLRPDELVVAVRVPLLGQSEYLRVMKVSKRKDLDISSVSAAFRFRLIDNVIDHLRIAFGGVGPRVMRLPGVEAVLKGQPVSLDLFERAAQLTADSVTPMSDVRGSDAYRRTLCRNAVLKLYHELDAGRFNGHPPRKPPTPSPASSPTQPATARA